VTPVRLKTIPQELWRRTPNNVFRTDLTTERFEELERLREHAVEFGDICRVNYGAQISSKEPGAFGRDRYLAKSDADMTDPKRFYEGSNMRPFAVTYDGYWVDMGPRDEMYGPRTKTFFESDKLSVRHISGDFDSFVAWVDEEHYYTDHGVIHAVPYHAIKDEESYRVTAEQVAVSKRYPLYYLLGILMSRSAMDLYAELYATGSLQGAFSHVYPDMVKGLPIPTLSSAVSEAPDDWYDTLLHEGTNERFSRSGVRRAFRTRDKIAAVLTAAARQRQLLEVGCGERHRDFATFMQVHSSGWRWKRGESLQTLPEETEFLQTVGDDLIAITTMNAVRSEYRQARQDQRRDADQSGVLQGMMDAMAATLYALEG
jgi:TaqI-like C-terminal specificity domain